MAAPCCADEVDSLLGVRKDMDHEATIAVRNEFMQVRASERLPEAACSACWRWTSH